MDVFIINLARSTDRLAFQRGQMAALGLGFERIAAVTAEAARAAKAAPYWESWERPLRLAERACFLSHVAAWERVAASDRPALILEDDAMLSRRVPALLAALAAQGGLDHVTLEVRGRRKLLGRGRTRLGNGLALVRLFQDRTGAAAYVLWPSGARKLLARAGRAAALADAMICKAYELSSWQVEPACAIQTDRAAHYGVRAPIETGSTIDGAGAERPASTPGQRRRRLLAQLRMGLRQLLTLGRASRREVAFDPLDFD